MAGPVLQKKSKELLGGHVYTVTNQVTQRSRSELTLKCWSEATRYLQQWPWFGLGCFFTIKAHSPKGNTRTDYLFRPSQARSRWGNWATEKSCLMSGQQGLRFPSSWKHMYVLRNIHVFHLLVSCMLLAQEINNCFHASLVWSWDRGQVPELWTKDNIWALMGLCGGIREGGDLRARIPTLSCYLLEGRSPWMCLKECVSYCVPSVGEESINLVSLSVYYYFYLFVRMYVCPHSC